MSGNGGSGDVRGRAARRFRGRVAGGAADPDAPLDAVDRAGVESFPASDAPPWTPEVALGAPRHAGEARGKPAIERPLAGDSLLFHLDDELNATHHPDILARSGRTARTLVKDESLRVTLHLIAPGGSIPEHHADGPITVQVLQGGMSFRAGDRDYDLRAGDLLALDTAIPHAVHSEEGVAFLLTVSLGEAGRHH